jgi:hypothetical protein
MSNDPEFLNIASLGIKDFPNSMEQFIETLDSLPNLSEEQFAIGKRVSSKELTLLHNSITNNSAESFTTTQLLELI